jgi:hypothetical protein
MKTIQMLHKLKTLQQLKNHKTLQMFQDSNIFDRWEFIVAFVRF